MVYEKDSEGKPQQTKNEFVAEALKYAYLKGIRPKSVLFDSKYSSSKILNLIDSYTGLTQTETERLISF